jgi:hypothetical protein
VQDILSDGMDIQFSEINAYEWNSDDYQDVEYAVIHQMFGNGSLGIPVENQSNAVNLFLVSTIPYANSGFTILGLSGGIGGPLNAGTGSSGLAFSSFSDLANFNEDCGIGTCDRDDQDEAFLEIVETIAHELGHYLGLNHPSERKISSSINQRHDPLTDTPQCKARTSGGNYYLDHKACLQDTENTLGGDTCDEACPDYLVGGEPTNYCPAATACQFNHVMWYTTKNREKDGSQWVEDGSIFSEQSKAIVLWNPFIL